MNKLGLILLIVCLFGGSAAVFSQQEVSTQPQKDSSSGKRAVTAVYGVTADDYLPTSEHTAVDYLRPKTRGAASRPAFDLPDAFYFIGGPIFLLILLRVLAIFITGFEERRKEEENQVASEQFNPD